MSSCATCGGPIAESAPACPACGALQTPSAERPATGTAEAGRRRQLERKRATRRLIILLGSGFIVLLAIAVVGNLLSPVDTADGPFSGNEFGACNVCVEHLQESGSGLPDGAVFPNCLLDVGASYQGDGIYDVSSSYSVPLDTGETTTQEYRCRAQIGEYGIWQILDLQLED